MDYLSDSSVSNQNPSPSGNTRFNAAWKHAHEKRQSDKKSVSSVKNAIHIEQQKNLEARLAMTEKQLTKARENTALLMKKLSEAEEELEVKEMQYEKEKKLREEKEIEIEQLRKELDKKINGHHDNSKHENEYQKENLENNINLIDNFKKKLENKEKEVDRLCLKIKSLELDRESHENQIKKLEQLNENMKKYLSESQHAMNQVYLHDYSKGAQLIELSQAKKTIQRLTLLLKATQQYKSLGQFAQQASHIHFLSNIPKRLKSNNLSYKYHDKKKMCSCMDVKIDQRLLWTPQNCYRVMLNMKIKYDSLTEDCIEEVLFELNKIWNAKEEVHIKRVRQYYQGEILRLKKRSEVRYDEMVARKQIQRLKKQLNCVKVIKKQSKGISLESLKNLGQYEDEVRVKEKQIKLLQERIRLLETESNSSDKVLYLEGALWIIEKILKEMDVNEEDLRAYENQFRAKIENNLCTQDWIRSFKQFFQTITQINNNLIDRLISMRESTLKKISGDRNTIFSSTKE